MTLRNIFRSLLQLGGIPEEDEIALLHGEWGFVSLPEWAQLAVLERLLQHM